jgi:hypothetical protein
MRVALEGIEGGASYEVVFIDEEHVRRTAKMSGTELARLDLRIDKPGRSLLVRYKQAK